MRAFPEKLVRLKGLEKVSSLRLGRVLSTNSDRLGLPEKSNLEIKGKLFSAKVINGFESMILYIFYLK